MRSVVNLLGTPGGSNEASSATFLQREEMCPSIFWVFIEVLVCGAVERDYIELSHTVKFPFFKALQFPNLRGIDPSSQIQTGFHSRHNNLFLFPSFYCLQVIYIIPFNEGKLLEVEGGEEPAASPDVQTSLFICSICRSTSNVF